MPKHIVRLLLVIVVVLVVSVIAKSYLTVDSFYRFGHYRANSVIEVAAKEPVFQTPRYCEGCHGAAQGHPQNGKLPIPSDTVKLCTLCHEAMPGRPRTQPQIQVAQHSSGQQCTICHNPHAPKIVAAPTMVAGNAAAGKQRAAA